jgi:hypothetical protein
VSEWEAALVRRYRRLLLAYPRWHRRLHGPDQLTVLVDLAVQRRRPPSVRDDLALVLDGLRCRLRVRGVAVVILAAVVSVVAAAGSAAAVGWSAWRLAVADWPTVDQTMRLAEPFAPRERPDQVSQRNVALGPWGADADSLLMLVVGSPELRPGGVYVSYSAAVTDPETVYAQAAETLAAQGWETSTLDGQVVAERDGLRLRVLCAGANWGRYDVIISLYPTPPAVAYGFAWLGAALGGLLGWLAVAAAIARARRLAPLRRGVMTLMATMGAVVSVPASALNFMAVTLADSDAGGAPPWVGYTFALARPGAVLGGLLLVIAWLLSMNGRSGVGGPLRAAGVGRSLSVE